jgi:Sec-independent protein translocase protein TatA
MEFLGIGAPELFFIFLIAIIVLGPKDMQKAGRTIGRWLNQLVRSDGWKALQQTSRELRNLPTTLMKEANLDLQETERAIRRELDIRPKHSSTSNPTRSLPPSNETENTIRPPSNDSAATQDGAGSITDSASPPSDHNADTNRGNKSESHG